MCPNCEVWCLNVINIVMIRYFNKKEHVYDKCPFLMIFYIKSYIVQVFVLVPFSHTY